MCDITALTALYYRAFSLVMQDKTADATALPLLVA